MDTEGVERIVIAEPSFDAGDHEVAEGADEESDDEGRHGANESGGRGDGDESGDGAGDAAESTGMTVVDPLHRDPAEGGSSGREVGGDEGAGGQASGGECTACVESEPAYPQHAGSYERENHAVRGQEVVGVVLTLAEVDGADEGRDSGGDMDDSASGEIEAGNASPEGGVEESALAPDHVGHGGVDEERPESEEEEHSAELHAFGEGSGDEGGGDDGEHELVNHERLKRDGGSVVGIRGGTDAVEEEVVEISDEAVAGAEGEAEADDAPEDGDDGHHGEALHHGGEDILAADEASVEEGEAGAGHHEDKGRADEHPGVVGVEACVGDLLLEVSELLGRDGLGSGGEGGEEQDEEAAEACAREEGSACGNADQRRAPREDELGDTLKQGPLLHPQCSRNRVAEIGFSRMSTAI